jgi:hypothetical protein
MATSENILLKNLSGQIGGQLVVKQWGGKTIITKYPDMSKRKLSPKQRHINKLMQEANYAAKGIMADETSRNAAQLRLNVTRNKLYTALIKEYFQLAKAGSSATEKK